MKRPRAVIVACLSLALSACLPPDPPVTEPVEPEETVPDVEPVEPKRPPYAEDVLCGKREWPDAWNDIVGEALDEFGGRLIPANIVVLCPKYKDASTDERKAFWALFIASVACFESSYNPETHYDEPPPLGYPSRGLLQLSYEDFPGHKRCELRRHLANAYDPRANLRCGVAILDDEMKRLGTLFHNKSYWSVLRPNRKAHLTRGFYEKQKHKLAFCF